MHFARRSFARTWAWQARFACREWLDYEPGAVMRPLHALVGDTDCFVITCNIDARFTRAGFDEFHVLETEGSVAKMTCSARCCDERHRTDEVVRALDASIVGGQVDQSLIPACPHCGAPLMCAIDERRLQQPDFQLIAQLDALEEFAQRHAGGNIVVLELGVGMRNGVVKRMLSHLVSGEPNLTYAVFNYNQVVFPHGLEQCCIGIDGDLAVAFAELSG